jgi:hypothetical protein
VAKDKMMFLWWIKNAFLEGYHRYDYLYEPEIKLVYIGEK